MFNVYFLIGLYANIWEVSMLHRFPTNPHQDILEVYEPSAYKSHERSGVDFDQSHAASLPYKASYLGSIWEILDMICKTNS